MYNAINHKTADISYSVGLVHAEGVLDLVGHRPLYIRLGTSQDLDFNRLLTEFSFELPENVSVTCWVYDFSLLN